VDPLHRGAAPLLFGTLTIENFTRYLIVAIGENVGFHNHRFSGYPLYRKAAAVDLWANPFDHHTAASISANLLVS
jgi:hypothetical protein